MRTFMLIIPMLILLCGRSEAVTIDSELAVRAIMGEARGETYRGKLAVAEAIRNRGKLSGVYGLHAKFKEPKSVWDDARKAWTESKKSNIVNGAQFWESVDFKKPYWSRNMKQTAKIGKHVFYKNN